MDLTTRCPRCGTVFQASLSDLQLRKGYIRCVQCSHIFDGYAEVVQDPARAGSARPSSSSVPTEAYLAPDAPSRPGAGPVFGAPAEDLVQIETTPQVIRAGRPASHRGVQAHAPEFTVGVAPWPDDGHRGRSAGDEPHVGLGAVGTEDEPDEWRDLPAALAAPQAIVVDPHPGYRSSGGSAAPLLDDGSQSPGLWNGTVRLFAGLLLAVLCIACVAQLTYVYRGQIAQFAPGVRPWLEQMCGPLHCRVPYARNIDQISVTGSALKVADTPAGSAAAPATSGPADGAQQQTQHFVLQLTLRNQLHRPQEWPTLVLDLKDGSGALLVRRNLSPAEYLGPAMAARPFAADSEALLRVPLALEGVRINGYQLDLFFP